MIASFIKYLLFTASFVHAVTRECVVSDWTSWSTCIGDCDYGLLVRNRDVVAPPFPLRLANGTVSTPLCPHLFETKVCIPDSCHSTQAVLPTQPFPTPGPLMEEVKAKKLEEERLNHSIRVDTTKLTLPIGEPADNETTRKPNLAAGDSRRPLRVAAKPNLAAGDSRRSLRVDGVPQRRALSRNGKHHRNTVRSTTESVPVDITTLIDLPSETIRQDTIVAKGSSTGTTASSSTEDAPESLVSTTGQTVRKEQVLENTSLQDERLSTAKADLSSTAETANTVIPAVPQESGQNSDYFINSLTIDIPMKKKITPEVERRLKTKLNINKIKYRNFGELDSPPTTTESTMNDVLRQLESAADLNIPLDDKHIRKALRKNRTLMKALLDAYKYRRSNNKSSEVMKNLVSNESTDSSSQSSAEAAAATTDLPTAVPGVWSRANYVPNTRQHASDITSKLYMTHEIVQALSDEPIRRSPILRVECLENPRCCKIERTVCPDGQKPKLIKRYYRPPGAAVCSPYHYHKCGQLEEMEEKPIEFEQNCQDLCFATSEKRIEPFTRIANDSS